MSTCQDNGTFFTKKKKKSSYKILAWIDQRLFWACILLFTLSNWKLLLGARTGMWITLESSLYIPATEDYIGNLFMQERYPVPFGSRWTEQPGSFYPGMYGSCALRFPKLTILAIKICPCKIIWHPVWKDKVQGSGPGFGGAVTDLDELHELLLDHPE